MHNVVVFQNSATIEIYITVQNLKKKRQKQHRGFQLSRIFLFGLAESKYIS